MVPKIKPRTKAPIGDQLTGDLAGELLAFYDVGLNQRGVSENTRYRYRGCLLRYQEWLGEAAPSLDQSYAFLSHLRESGYAPASVKVYRGTLAVFHEGRGETLKYRVKVPSRQPPYIDAETVEALLEEARKIQRLDHFLALTLMAFCGLRREEVANLRVGDVNLNQKCITVIGKGDKQRTIPLLMRLLYSLGWAMVPSKGPGDRLVGLSDRQIYTMVKKYGAQTGHPEIHPHDLRHAFITRLTERGANIKAVQALAGHESLTTTSAYIGITGKHLEETMRLLD